MAEPTEPHTHNPTSNTPPQLDITWDSHKAQSNLTKHGVGFVEAATVLLDPLAVTVFDADHSDFEERWFTLGQSSQGRVLALAHTYSVSGPASIKVRMISARETTRHERRQLENDLH